MRTIYKYPLEEDSFQTGANPEVLFVGIDPKGVPCVWIEHDISEIRETHTVLLQGTGWTVKERSFYLGSYVSGELVWHFYSQSLKRKQ